MLPCWGQLGVVRPASCLGGPVRGAGRTGGLPELSTTWRKPASWEPCQLERAIVGYHACRCGGRELVEGGAGKLAHRLL